MKIVVRRDGEWRLTAEKLCPVCRDKFYPREREAPNKWQRRATCSIACAGTYGSAQYKPK